MTSIDDVLHRWEVASPSPESSVGVDGAFVALPLWQTFDRVAERYPDRVALTFGDRRMTYRELQAQAGQLAGHLRVLGVGPESLVGVFLERSIEAIVALVAVVKAGGAYLPLDPAYPASRVQMILEDARPVVLLTQEALESRFPAHSAHVVCLDKKQTWETAPATSNLSGPENLAYVIYTSGSTGKPKGVMVTHGNAARLLTATNEWFHFNESDVWTLFHSVAFDFSVWEIWGALLFGGRLVIVPFSVSRSPEDFYALLVREGVTVLNQTPSAFYQLIAVDQEQRSPDLALRVVVFGGEALNFAALRPWFGLHGDRQPRLVNMYGITETTVHVTYRELALDDAAGGTQSLIGVPIPDLQLYLLGPNRERVAEGEVGEIYVGGAGVARGYLNRPELNAERFLADPFSKAAVARMYKSGDLARYLPGGELEYLGRGDDQVKIQGFRIELGEVEAAVVGHPEVSEARVIAHTDASGNKRLVAYFVAQSGGALPAGELSGFLSGKLPPWMMPAIYLQVEAFPLTPHGKVDYAALPAPTFGSLRTGNETIAVAGNDLEQAVAGVWRAVLGAEHVGLDDNFFDVGGTSLLLVSVHGKLQALLQRKISVTDLFGYPTVRALADRLGGTATTNGSSDSARAGVSDAGLDKTEDRAQKQRAAFAKARAMKRAGL